MRHLVRWILVGALMALRPACGTEIVRFPMPEFAGDHRYDYAQLLLEVALRHSASAFEIRLADTPMSQERQVQELEAGRTIDVAPIPSSAEREARLLPIRIPINKGVLGWRLGLIRRGEEDILGPVRSLDDLKGVRLAQGQEWPDTQILRANGLQVMTAPRYEDLFKMLVARRYDYFPRSVMEIWDEQANYTDTLEVEPHVALHYFYDAYFMVSPKNTRLAELIRTGLEKAIADGSFDKLFWKYYGERLRKAHLESRTVIEMKNPLMTTAETPTNRPELWYGSERLGKPAGR